MRLKAVILALLTVAVYAAGRHQQRLKLLRDTVSYGNVQETYFRVNQRYKFRYDGQVNIGVPDHSNQYSASRFRADVTLMKRSEEHFIMRMNNFRLGKQLAYMQDMDELASFERFDPAEMKQSELRMLEMPVEFTYAEGQVQELAFQQDDEEWSENIKRGVINLFQIKLQSTDRTSMEEEQAALNRVDTESKTDVGTAYRTREKTVEGECDAMYTVSPMDDEDREQNSRMLVSKSIDMDSCYRRPEIWRNYQFISPCPRCEKLPRSGERSVDSSTTIRYQIRGKRDRFLIERAELCNDHVVTQQSADESTVMVKIRASLNLMSSEEANEGSSEMSSYPATGQRVSDIVYSTRDDEDFDRFYAEDDQHYHDRWYGQWQQQQQGQDKSAALAEIMMKMMRHMKDTADEKANRYFYKAVQLVRHMSESEIRSTSNNHFGRQQAGSMTPEERERARNIMPNILAQAGTRSSFRQLADQIANREMSPFKAAMVITTMMHTPRASQEMIAELMRLEKSEMVQQYQPLKTAVLLTAGSMMRTMCGPQRRQFQQREDYRYDNSPQRRQYQQGENYGNENTNSNEQGYEQGYEQRCNSETKQRFVRAIADRLANNDRWEDKVLLLRTLGNAGLDASIYELERIVRNQDRRNSAPIRLEAVLALRHMRDSLPQKTKNILLSTAANRMESSAVRMAAIQMLLQQYPDRMTIDQMGIIMNHDPNRRVASFAYKLVRRLADSDQPCYEENKLKLQTTARSIRRRNLQLPYSDVIFESLYDREKKTGYDFFLMPMYDMDDMVPKFMRAGVNMVERGERNRNYFAFEFGSSSLSMAMSEWLQDMNQYTQQDQGMNQYREQDQDKNQYTEQNQASRTTQYKMNLRRMAEKMRRNGNSETRQGQTKAWMSMKFRDQDIMLLTFNENRLREMIRERRGSESLLRYLLAKMAGAPQGSINMDEAALLRETIVKIPTAVGSQLTIRRKTPAMFTAHGHASFGRGTPMEANIQARISATISMVTDVSSRSPMFTNGIYLIKNIKATMPFDMAITMDHKEQDEQLKVRMRNPGGYKDLLKLESRPVIYYSRSQNPLDEREEKTVVAEKNVRMESFKRCMWGPLFGAEICMRGVITMPMCNHNKLLHYQAPWFGPNKVVLSWNPDGRNKEVTVSAYVRNTENQNENRVNRQVGLTMRGDSMQNRLNVEYELTDGSMIPTRFNAKWHRQSHGGQDQEFCVDMNAQRQNDEQRSEQTGRNGYVNINWGRQCNDDNYIKAKIETASRNRYYRDQQGTNAMQDNYEERERRQMPYSVTAEETAGYKVQIQYRNVPQWFAHRVEDAMRMVTSTNYWNSEVDYYNWQGQDRAERNGRQDEQNHEGEIRMQAIMRNEDNADIKIQTPRRTIRLYNAYMPTLLRRETYRRSNIMRFMNLYLGGNHAKGTCRVSQNSIRTFDGAMYSVPFSDCYTILAKDNEEDPNFAIMTRRSREQPDKKIVKVMTSDHEIELYPQGDRMEVTVDGQRWDDRQAKQHSAMRIYRRGSYVTVDLNKPNVDLHTDGNEINIRVSNRYHGRQTGMCGNLNADSSDEFQTRNGRNRNDIWEMFNEMTIKDSCQQPRQEDQYQYDQYDSQRYGSYYSDSGSDSDDNWAMARQHRTDEGYYYDDEEEGSMFDSDREPQQQQQQRPQQQQQQRPQQQQQQYQRGDQMKNQNDRSLAIEDVTTEMPPVRRNKVIENHGRKCISMRPIERCPEHSYAAQGEREQRDVPYTCLTGNDELRHYMGRQQRQGMSMDLSKREVSFTRREMVPKKCISMI